MTITVEIADRVDDELISAFGRLIPQLSKSNPAPSRTQLEDIVSSPATMLFVARAEGRIVGALTLALFRLPTGLRAWIEDVVVDSDVRGSGIGEKLSRAALDEAKIQGAVTVDLTSRPSRVEANRLYQRLGFVARDTNVYRFQFKD
jgi:ribosomal protein S18 acetylase RimI-like enzyme